MRVTILGSGKVAEALASVIGSGLPGVEPGEIWARSDKGADIAARTGFGHAADPGKLAPADLYIIAVSDGVIRDVSSAMAVPPGAVVAHTSGATDMDAIITAGAGQAVFYPLQTFSEGRPVDFSKVPIFIEYAAPHAGKVIRRFAESVSANVYEADSRLRAKLHTAAVFACNFTNIMYSISARMAREEGLPFDIFKPLIEETAAKAAASDDPATIQTGPAVRGDTATLERHLELLRGEAKEEYEEIYRLLTKAIWEISRKT